MRKLSMAAVLVGLCFGAADVRAADAYSCKALKEFIEMNLRRHDARDRDALESTKKELTMSKSDAIHQSEMTKMLDRRVNQYRIRASQWATIYIALCKQ